RWPAQSLPFSSFSLQARMRGMRRFTLVPSLSVATSSATGIGLSEAAYFGLAIAEVEYNRSRRRLPRYNPRRRVHYVVNAGDRICKEPFHECSRDSERVGCKARGGGCARDPPGISPWPQGYRRLFSPVCHLGIRSLRGLRRAGQAAERR